MGNTSNQTPENLSPASKKEAVGALKKQTNQELSPLAYGAINKNIEGNLEHLEQELVLQKKLKTFESIVQKKARKTWLEKFANNTKEIGEETKRDFVKVVSGDPEVEMAFSDLVSFDKANASVSVGVLAYNYFSGRTRDAVRLKDGVGNKTLAVLKPVIIANAILQPAVLGAIGSVGKNIVGRGIYNASKITKNALYGTLSGDLLSETKKLGKNGDPIEYLWNGKTYRQRHFDVLKNPDIYETPQKLRPYFGVEVGGTFDAIDGYKKNPEKIEPYIGKSAEFVFRSAQNSFSQKELQDFIVNMEAGVWDEPMVRKAVMTSASGGMLKFFLETASDKHRKMFLDSFQKISQKKNPPTPFTDKDLKIWFPSVSKKSTKKEKKGIRAALSLGLGGLASGVFLLTTLLSKILFKFGKNAFDLTDIGSGGWDRIGDRAKGAFAKKKSDVKKFQEYESKKFKALLRKGKSKDSLEMLGGRGGILTDKEIAALNGKNVSHIQRKKIADELGSFMKEKKRIDAEEFWELDSVKTLRGKKIRERTGG